MRGYYINSMKIKRIFLVGLLLTLFLCACSNSKADSIYRMEKWGKTFEVNTENGTISDGMYTYEYTFFGNSSDYEITITYPDGTAYYWNQNGMRGSGGGGIGYSESIYTSGTILCDVLAANAPEASNPMKFFAVILLIGFGIFDVLFPEISWTLAYGWRYKNAEPSDMALGLIRIGGVIVIIIGIVLIFL